VRRVLSALEEYGSPLLITLTFSGSASDAFYAKDALSRFTRRLRVKYPESSSVFVPELSPRGRIHFHGLLFGVPSYWGDLRQGGRVVSYGSERTTRELAGLWREGFLDALQTDGSPKLASYIAKYLTKGSSEVLFNGMRMLRFSQNFSKELVIKDERLCARFLSLYENRKPSQLWESFTVFTGKISKRKFTKD